MLRFLVILLLQLQIGTGFGPVADVKGNSSALSRSRQHDHYDGNDEIRLFERIVANYQGFGLGRPVMNVRKPMDIYFRLTVDEFSELDEQLGTVRIIGTVTAMWRDEFLRWNASHFNGIDALVLKDKGIYMPVIIPVGRGTHNAPIFHQNTAHGGSTPVVWTDNNGLVHATITETFETTCKIDLAKFPLDTQNCHFFFKVLRFRRPHTRLRLFHHALLQSDAMDINHGPSAMALVDEVEDKEAEAAAEEEDDDEEGDAFIDAHHSDSQMWHLIGTNASETMIRTRSGLAFSAIVYTVTVERKSDFYLWHILLPTASMALVQTSVFFLPFSPERVMYCITSVLAVDIFQSSLQSKMNSGSEPVPLVKYSTAQLVMGILITIESIIALTIVKQKNALPRLVVRFVEILNGDEEEDEEDNFVGEPIPPFSRRGSKTPSNKSSLHDQSAASSVAPSRRNSMGPNRNITDSVIPEEEEENEALLNNNPPTTTVITNTHTTPANLTSMAAAGLGESRVSLATTVTSRHTSLGTSQTTLNTLGRARRKHKAGRSRLLAAQQWSAKRISFEPQTEVALIPDESEQEQQLQAETASILTTSRDDVKAASNGSINNTSLVAGAPPPTADGAVVAAAPTPLKSALIHRSQTTLNTSQFSGRQSILDDNIVERFELAALMDRIGLTLDIIFFLVMPFVFFRLIN